MAEDSTIDHDKALREVVSRAGAIAQDPLARGEVRTLAAAICLLSVIVGKQADRIRVLEPCPSRSEGGPHTWAAIGKRYADPGDDLRCIYCDIRRRG